MATSKKIQRIQGEKEPLLKLSELTARERLEVLNVSVRYLKPFLQYMRGQKLEQIQIIEPSSEHATKYGEGLHWDTKALLVYRLLHTDESTSGDRRTMSAVWLALTAKGVWIYWDAEGYGSEENGFSTKSSFLAVPRRQLLDMLQGEPGARIVRGVVKNLHKNVANLLRSREQQAQEIRRVFDASQALTRDVVNLLA